MNERNGFTLVEVLIALAVAALMLVGIYGVITVSQKSAAGMDRKVVAQKDVRSGLDLMALELRMASYNSSLDNAIWRSTADCTAAAANPLYKGIQAATPFSITIEMDANDNAVVNGTSSNPNEIITYTYDTANLRITRSTNCGSALPFLGDTAASGRPRIIRIVNDLNSNNAYDAAVDVPVFRYFDFNNKPILPANLPAQIPNIRAIEITLAADTEHADPTTQARRRIVYSTRVIPRNHGANP
ncbi:MAG: prepilin-type N-terminal cleavage/methylation domain-containing protein [Deltaproteobacteria bacterium]